MNYTKLADMTGDRTFQTAGVTYDAAASGFTNASAQDFGNGVQVVYNAAGDSYTLSATGAATATFAPANLVQPPPASNTMQYTLRNNANVPTDVLTLNVPQTAGGVPLSYTLIGTWASRARMCLCHLARSARRVRFQAPGQDLPAASAAPLTTPSRSVVRRPGLSLAPQAAEMGYGFALSAGGFSAVGAVAGAKQ